MQIIQTKSLSEQQKKNALFIADACINKFHMTLTFPIEEDASYYLLYDPTPVSVLVLMPEEVIAFTLPQKQQLGYFSALMEAIEDEIADTDLLFYIDHSNKGAEKTMESLEAELQSDEYRMVLSLEEFPSPDSCFTEETADSKLVLQAVRPEDSGSLYFTFCEKSNPDLLLGSARAALFKSAACIYDFEIHSEFRRQGFGLKAILLLLTHMKKQGMISVFLHVSADNEAAVKLYKKTGFRIAETLSCYLY